MLGEHLATVGDRHADELLEDGVLADCRHCGVDAGLGSGECNRCGGARRGARSRVTNACVEAARSGEGIDALEERIRLVRDWGFLTSDEEQESLAGGWRRALDGALGDDLLGNHELQSLVRYRGHFNLSESDLCKSGHWRRLRQATLLKMIAEKRQLPRPEPRNSGVPIELEEGETLVWTFPKVAHRTKERGIVSEAAKGTMSVTMQRVIFIADEPDWETDVVRKIQIRLDGIDSVDIGADGLEFVRSTPPPMSECFRTGDGHFARDLINALCGKAWIAENLVAPRVDDLLSDEAAIRDFFGGPAELPAPAEPVFPRPQLALAPPEPASPEPRSARAPSEPTPRPQPQPTVARPQSPYLQPQSTVVPVESPPPQPSPTAAPTASPYAQPPVPSPPESPYHRPKKARPSSSAKRRASARRDANPYG